MMYLRYLIPKDPKNNSLGCRHGTCSCPLVCSCHLIYRRLFCSSYRRRHVSNRHGPKHRPSPIPPTDSMPPSNTTGRRCEDRSLQKIGWEPMQQPSRPLEYAARHSHGHLTHDRVPDDRVPDDRRRFPNFIVPDAK